MQHNTTQQNKCWQSVRETKRFVAWKADNDSKQPELQLISNLLELKTPKDDANIKITSHVVLLFLYQECYKSYWSTRNGDPRVRRKPQPEFESYKKWGHLQLKHCGHIFYINVLLGVGVQCPLGSTKKCERATDFVSYGRPSSSPACRAREAPAVCSFEDRTLRLRLARLHSCNNKPDSSLT